MAEPIRVAPNRGEAHERNLAAYQVADLRLSAHLRRKMLSKVTSKAAVHFEPLAGSCFGAVRSHLIPDHSRTSFGFSVQG